MYIAYRIRGSGETATPTGSGRTTPSKAGTRSRCRALANFGRLPHKGLVAKSYLFRQIGIDWIAIGIPVLIPKSEGNRGSTRASALAGLIASAPDFERSGDCASLRPMPHTERSKSGAEAIIERVALPSGPAKALARRSNQREIRVRRQRQSAAAFLRAEQFRKIKDSKAILDKSASRFNPSAQGGRARGP